MNAWENDSLVYALIRQFSGADRERTEKARGDIALAKPGESAWGFLPRKAMTLDKNVEPDFTLGNETFVPP
jgi:hypothetical protein